ncbi:class I SAM-dependent methyltransferase [Oscillatoria salina]|uniref:class I SAM-dependent methyltransferase n=1 Tax=Oscillatoria salina TaxID=331517 RepID=UPI0013BB59BD|nr:class I SAM-dependent methyltransferase [Oscillatoria salina]MBZ8180183.1 class I SAM-dependent methyltransferase [Oscillatoria salina IIICB1]NET91515.1 class I SAM-dependent methyltransferase [Kamptonema sp. SIO1D9]
MNNQQLTNIIREKIANSPQKRITFAEYMNLVLYHPQYGYYSGGTVQIGSKGDFFTSSSLSADFGELLAIQFVQMWELLAQPNPFMLVEMGAGQGLLATDILQYLSLHHPDFLTQLEYIIIEQAPSLITQQQQLLQQWLEKGMKISWKTWAEIPPASLIGCCFSNELVDAFPVHQIILQQGQLQEIYVTNSLDTPSSETKANFLEISALLSTPQITEYFQLIDIDLNPENYPDGYRSEVNLAALDWIKTVAQKLQLGYLLTIDYGYPATKYYHPQRAQGTRQCYYQHRRHNNPFLNIGRQDITAFVDFTALERQGELCGLEKIGFTQQGMFLMALGLGNRLSSLPNGKLNLPQILARRDALHQLIDPTGLGGFGILIQSKNLPQKAKSLQGLSLPPML